jgi:hypothetical protein
VVAAGFEKSSDLRGIFEFARYWYGKAAPAVVNIDRRDAFATASASLRSKAGRILLGFRPTLAQGHY